MINVIGTIISLFFVFIGIYVLIRNNKVYKEMDKIIDILYIKPINEDDDYKKIKDVFNKHSYTEMILKFWIPVKNFYKDISIEGDND